MAAGKIRRLISVPNARLRDKTTKVEKARKIKIPPSFLKEVEEPAYSCFNSQPFSANVFRLIFDVSHFLVPSPSGRGEGGVYFTTTHLLNIAEPCCFPSCRNKCRSIDSTHRNPHYTLPRPALYLPILQLLSGNIIYFERHKSEIGDPQSDIRHWIKGIGIVL